MKTSSISPFTTLTQTSAHVSKDKAKIFLESHHPKPLHSCTSKQSRHMHTYTHTEAHESTLTNWLLLKPKHYFHRLRLRLLCDGPGLPGLTSFPPGTPKPREINQCSSCGAVSNQLLQPLVRRGVGLKPWLSLGFGTAWALRVVWAVALVDLSTFTMTRLGLVRH